MNKMYQNILTLVILVAYSQYINGATMEESIEERGGKKILKALYCNEAMSTKGFYAWGRSLTEVQPNTFWKCKEVNEIYLHKNQIKELHKDTFKFNAKTKTLSLDCNKLSFLPNELFKPMVNLEHLDLSGNPLGTYEPVLASQLPKLISLAIVGIKLHELSPQIVKEKLPQLKKIRFDKNLIECNTFESLRSELSIRGISSEESMYECVSSFKKCLTPEEKQISTLLLGTPKNVFLQNQHQGNLDSQILDIIQRTSSNFTEFKNQQIQARLEIDQMMNIMNETISAQIQEIGTAVTNFKQLLDEQLNQIRSEISDNIQKTFDNFTEVNNQQMEIRMELYEKLNETNESVLSINQSLVDFKQSADEEREKLKSQILDIIKRTSDNFTIVQDQQLKAESMVENMLVQINDIIEGQKQNQSKLSFEINSIGQAVRLTEKRLQEHSKHFNDKFENISKSVSVIFNQTANLEEKYLNLSIDSHKNHSQVYQLHHIGFVDLKNNHDDFSKNVSDALNQIRKNSDDKLKTLWLALIFVTVGFCLITGYLSVRIIKNSRSSIPDQARENILEMNSHI